MTKNNNKQTKRQQNTAHLYKNITEKTLKNSTQLLAKTRDNAHAKKAIGNPQFSYVKQREQNKGNGTYNTTRIQQNVGRIVIRNYTR